MICFRTILTLGWVGTTAIIYAADPAMQTLSGHVPATTRHWTPTGMLPPTNRMNLAIGLSVRDPKGLDDFLSQIYDPAGPNYRQYLTPEQFTERFGPTEKDYQAVIAFAERNGLKVTARHANRLLLDVHGSVVDVQRAFHLMFRVFRHPNEARDFYAPDVEPSVDVKLPIADISGLSDFVLPHPKNRKQNSSPAEVRLTPKSGSVGGSYLGNDFRAAYLPGVALTGAGQTVGLLQFDGFYASDISDYESTAGLPAVPLQTVLLDGYTGLPTTGPSSGNAEVSLDIEMTISMAPGLSKIVVFEAGPKGLPNDILNAMAASDHISQFSCSWGWSGGPSTTTDNIFKQMAAQGQSFFNASGDSDAFTPGSSSVNGVDNLSLANAPSSSPYITMVGGTTLTTSGPGGLWSAETVWNWGQQDSIYTGSSGGISSFYAIPSWQTAVNMASNGGSTTARNIPDVALTADNVYVQYGNGARGTLGGTSCAAPLWAGLAALMNQQAIAAGRPTIGFVNPAIYALGKSSGYGASFHDITTGNNTWPSSSHNFFAVTGYDLCTGWGTPAGQSLIDAIAGSPDALRISPATSFISAGMVGGPFSPTATSLQLTNSSAASLTWSLINTSAWLQATSTGGSLPVGAATNVTVTLSAVANTLPVGSYAASLIFTNWNSHLAQGLSVSLQVLQSLVQNGGFEAGDFTGWTFVGDTTIATRHGTTLYDGVENSTQYPLAVHGGTYGAYLGDIKLATLSQTLATAPGENYRFSFWLNNPTSGSVQQFQVNWNGNPICNLLNPPAFSWTNLQFIVTAAGNNTVLQFGVENDPDYFGLDDISVTHIPAVALTAISNTSGKFCFTWATAAGVGYQVQYKTNLLQPNWLNLGTPILAASTSLSLSDPITPLPRFYRVSISP